MIQINLLPPEYRPRTGTPVGRFVAIIVGVVVIACATGAWFYTHFIELAQVRELRDVRTEEATTKERQRDHSLALQRELDSYEKRRTAIQTINRSRTLWSRKLDQFFDIVTSNQGDQAYHVWLDNLEVPPQVSAARSTRGRARRGSKAPENGGMFRFTGSIAMEAASDGPALNSLFYRAITGDPDATGQRTDFFEDFLSINNPNISVTSTPSSRDGENVLVPPVVGTFRYELTLKPPDALTERRAERR